MIMTTIFIHEFRIYLQYHYQLDSIGYFLFVSLD